MTMMNEICILLFVVICMQLSSQCCTRGDPFVSQLLAAQLNL